MMLLLRTTCWFNIFCIDSASTHTCSLHMCTNPHVYFFLLFFFQKDTWQNTSSLLIQTQNSQNGRKVNPVDKEILQLCIKEDTQASNYSNGASCHISNMTMHTPYSINQETATCLSQHRAAVWWKIIYANKISHNSKAKIGLFVAMNKSL